MTTRSKEDQITEILILIPIQKVKRSTLHDQAINPRSPFIWENAPSSTARVKTI